MTVIAHALHMCNVSSMSKMIQVRNVPDDLHGELVRRAERSGRTLTDYIQEILEREVARPPRGEIFERVAGRSRVELARPLANVLREERPPE